MMGGDRIDVPSGIDPFHPALAVPVLLAVVGLGAVIAVILHRKVASSLAGTGGSPATSAAAPLREARWLARQQVVTTERPDLATWILAPAAYLGLAVAALSVVPLSAGVAVADVRTGIVVFGAAEALAIVVIFLHGWSPNSPYALISAYRFVAVALSYELLSMFVLIAAAIPAGSLSIGAIVDSQAGLWNVVRQPLGLPLWLVVSWGVTFSGPLAVVDSADLAGGGGVEDSGLQRLAWAGARAAMLVVFAAAGATVFLGGWQGPVLPGGAWMALKTAALLAVLVVGDITLARMSAQRFVRLAWAVLLPLAFLDLLIAGLGSL
ncbi:NADH-quinone oxidoreductase subunit H [Iamia majanohamensis]|uniref:NADH-quinone oxidoreductase subunit H n=1 Tax=Iamia majanohamensis TaxID=467976 RepID=A0AAE9YGD6_9ACTN|nr:NADH-quinone oxidoreductase subunit H [Iamia majanohamensis]WCO68027.1 NADH-quinone oxidoreductase subunit H [Iamia majanohamensis]